MLTVWQKTSQTEVADLYLGGLAASRQASYHTAHNHVLLASVVQRKPALQGMPGGCKCVSRTGDEHHMPMPTSEQGMYSQMRHNCRALSMLCCACTVAYDSIYPSAGALLTWARCCQGQLPTVMGMQFSLLWHQAGQRCRARQQAISLIHRLHHSNLHMAALSTPWSLACPCCGQGVRQPDAGL